VVAALQAVTVAMKNSETELGKLDAVAGDGDHGRGMVRGSSAAALAAELAAADGGELGHVLVAAGDAWAARAGGTSGALWGAALHAAGSRLATSVPLRPEDVIEATRSALAAVQALGGAKQGDKTLVDVLIPFCVTLASEVDRGRDLRVAWRTASEVAAAASLATAQMSPRIGRAVPLARRSLGNPDPGAVSLARSLGTVADWWDTVVPEQQAGKAQGSDEEAVCG